MLDFAACTLRKTSTSMRPCGFWKFVTKSKLLFLCMRDAAACAFLASKRVSLVVPSRILQTLWKKTLLG